jgi:hypothetical protein
MFVHVYCSHSVKTFSETDVQAKMKLDAGFKNSVIWTKT